jgi:hypothetical protein
MPSFCTPGEQCHLLNDKDEAAGAVTGGGEGAARTTGKKQATPVCHLLDDKNPVTGL